MAEIIEYIIDGENGQAYLVVVSRRATSRGQEEDAGSVPVQVYKLQVRKPSPRDAASAQMADAVLVPAT